MAEVTARGVRFHVQMLESGRAVRHVVVFLHGLVMDNLSSWYFTAANPASRVADVLLYDLRGHGKSERPKTGYTVADMVADLSALVDTLAPERRVHLVGNSFGGLLGLAFARSRPERVGSLTLVDAHLGNEGFGVKMAETLALEGEERDRKIAESFANWLGRHSDRKRNRLAQNARELVTETSLLSDMRETPPLAPHDLASLRAPVLGIYGERSELRETAATYLAALPRGKLVVVPGCTHSVLWEATDEVRRLIVDFLRLGCDEARP